MQDKFNHIQKKLTLYILVTILIGSTLLHIYYLIEHPGSNFIKPSKEEIEEQLENGEISEEVAKLKEHTWKYGSRDAYLYTKMANQIIEDGIYGYNTDLKSNAFVTPGFPMLLVALFQIANLLNMEQMTIVKVFNLLLSVGTIWLVYLIAKNVVKSRWAGVIASGLYATYFTPLHFFRTALTEIPAIFFFCLATYIFILAIKTDKKYLHFLFAVIFCYSVMIRPVIAPLVLIGFLIISMKYRSNLKQWLITSGIWALGAFIVIGPWVIRNFILFHEFILFSTHSGNSWFAGSNPFNMYDFYDYFKEQEKLGLDSKEYALMKIKEGFQTNFGLWFAWFTVGKTYELFKLPDAIYFYPASNITLYFKIVHTIIVNTAFVSLFISMFIRNKRIVAISGMIIMYIALSNLFLTIPRYGFFIIPMMCVLNGCVAVTIVKKLMSAVTNSKSNYQIS